MYSGLSALINIKVLDPPSECTFEDNLVLKLLFMLRPKRKYFKVNILKFLK